jgi:hypothetical protein
MRLDELHEDRKVVDTEDKLIDLIRTECSTFLAAYKQTGKYLFRGVKGSGAFIDLPIRKDRKPVEMPPAKHKALEAFFQEQGFTVNRTNGLFATARFHLAEDWGDPYVIFVKNGWKCLVFDNKLDDYAYYELSAIAGLSMRGDDDVAEEAFARLKPREFKTTGALAAFIKKDPVEALFAGEGYIGIDVDSSIWPTVKQALGLK